MRHLPLRSGTVDLERGVVARDGAKATLTGLEARLLRALVAHPGEDLERDLLYALVWEYVPKGPSRSLDIAVARLREKIEVDPKKPDHVITVHRTGYRFVAAESRQALVEPVLANGARLDVLLAQGEACLRRDAGGDPSAREEIDGLADELLQLASAESRVEEAARARLVGAWALGVSGQHHQEVETLRQAAAVVAELSAPMRIEVQMALAFAVQRLGQAEEALGWLTAALDEAMLRDDVDHEVRIRTGLGLLHHHRQDFGAALAHLEAASALSAKPRLLGDALAQLAMVLLKVGRRAEARKTIERSLLILREAHSRWLCRALLTAGMVWDDDLRRSKAAFEEAAVVAEGHGVPTVASTARLNLALVALFQGDRVAGRSGLEGVVKRFSALGFPMNHGIALFHLAALDVAEGRDQEALARLRVAGPMMTARPAFRGTARTLTGWILARNGDVRAARAALADGAAPIGDPELASSRDILRAAALRALGEEEPPLVTPVGWTSAWLAGIVAEVEARRPG